MQQATRGDGLDIAGKENAQSTSNKKELSRREQLELWKQQRKSNDPTSARRAHIPDARSLLRAADQSKPPTRARSAPKPAVQHQEHARTAARKPMQEIPKTAKVAEGDPEKTASAAALRNHKKTTITAPHGHVASDTAAVTRVERLKQYREGQQRIKDHAARVAGPPKKQASSRTAQPPSKAHRSTNSSGPATDLELQRFRSKIEKAMRYSQLGKQEEARAIFKTLQGQERFSRFRSTSEYWVALARFEEECQNFAEVIRLLDTASLACANKVEDSFHLGNALAGFLIRVNDNSTNAMRPAHEEDQAVMLLPQTPRTPTQQLPSSSSVSPSPFFFNELAPESEEFLYECLQKARPLDRSQQQHEPRPSTAATTCSSGLSPYHRLRQVVETIRSSPRSAHLPNKSPGLSRSIPRSIVLMSPYSSAEPPATTTRAALNLSPTPDADRPAADQLPEEGLPLPAFGPSESASPSRRDNHQSPPPPPPPGRDLAAAASTPRLSTSVVPASPSPPELSESFHQLTSSGRNKKQLLQSPSAPKLTLTTRLALGEALPDDDHVALDVESGPCVSRACSSSARGIEWEKELPAATPITMDAHCRAVAPPSSSGRALSPHLTNPQRVLQQPLSPSTATRQTAKRRPSLPNAAAKTFSSPTVSSSQRAVAASVSRFPHHTERRLAASRGDHLIRLAVHNRSELSFATPQSLRQASPQRAGISTATTAPVEDVDSSSERTCGTASSRGHRESAHQHHDDDDAGTDLLLSDFATLSLSSADVSLSSESESALNGEGEEEGEEESKHDRAPQLPSEGQVSLTPLFVVKPRNTRAFVRASEIQPTTPGYGRFDTYAPVRRTSSMRNAELMDVTVALSPIGTPSRSIVGTPVSTPGINPLTPFHGAAESVSGEQAESSSRPCQEEQKNGGLTFTPVRRSLRLNNKATTPMAKMNTPFPFGRDRHLRSNEVRTDAHPEGEGAATITAPAGQTAATPAETRLRVNTKDTTPTAKMNTPFPFARRRFASNQPAVVLLANPHLTSNH